MQNGKCIPQVYPLQVVYVTGFMRLSTFDLRSKFDSLHHPLTMKINGMFCMIVAPQKITIDDSLSQSV